MSATYLSPQEVNVSSGLDRCVVYTSEEAVVWRGMVSIDEEYEGREPQIVYVDGNNARISIFGTDFKAKIQTYTFPEEILDTSFDMVYRTYTSKNPDDYDIHIVYNCRARLEGTAHQTSMSETNPEWFDISIVTENKSHVFGNKPTAHYVIRSTDIWTSAIDHIMDVLYGDDEESATLPPIEDILEILEQYVSLRITDHGDGTWDAEELNNATGIIQMVTGDEFTIEWPSAVYIGDDIYTVHSL